MTAPGPERPFHPADREIILRFEGVSFSYGPVKVLERASFHVHQGECIALVGPNGSGKTTALKLILGLERPREGAVALFGPGGVPLPRERVGYVPQQAAYDRAFPISVAEVVRMGRLRPLSRRSGPEDAAAVREALEQAEIADLAARPYSGLSGGQRRRVLVARALAARPEILILDEPTANMDAESEERLFRTLGRLKGGATILIVTHDTEFVSPLIDRALCMGSRESGEYGIVQHRIEDRGEEGPGGRNSRVIHGEIIPGDRCFDAGGPLG
jgi:zinc transport system ATP-binding protein